ATVAELAKVARLNPLEALKVATRAPVIAGRRFVDSLDDLARANLDGMLFELSLSPPGDLELLLDRLDDLAKRSDTAQVPASGAGVKLSTVHASKGLEYPLVAVFDAGARDRDRPQAVLVDPASGVVALRAAGTDDAAQRQRRERDRHESYRLLYVAASRARDSLLISGSVSRSAPQGWLERLLAMGFEGDQALPGVSVEHLPWREVAASVRVEPVPRIGLPSSPWVERRFPHHRHGPLSSPSRLVGLLSEHGGGGHPAAADDEPLTWTQSVSAGDDGAGYELTGGPDGAHDSATGGVLGDLPGLGRVLGTLVHFAISRDWSPDDRERLESLRTQEVMFPYSVAQQDDILAELRELLGNYRAMLGSELPALGNRLVDRAEIPLAYRGGPTVWEGVIDRLYRTPDGWVIDDYKTDRVVRPERYFVQLGLYLHAVSGALEEVPRGRLVYLRSRTILEPDPAELAAALERSGIVTAR
ncbi:MAG TPA: 3'-5' exonuclease, partial [Trueperaceae bacterium]|nr:3'-5' exonuclease [Trueperaceae bacterium]